MGGDHGCGVVIEGANRALQADKNIKALDKGVQKMFDHFPPDAKK